MAQVSINIRKNNAGADTTITVSGVVDDRALAPFTDQLAVLLSATAGSIPVSSVPSISSSSTAASA